MPKKLHRYKDGAWSPMSASDTQIRYDDEWHNPCAGPKTLWHFVDGTWEKFPCGSEMIYFMAYPNDWEGAQRVQAINADGSSVTSAGDKVTAFTVSALSQPGYGDWKSFLLERDYSALYAVRDVGGAHDFFWNRDMFLEFGGESVPLGIVFDLTNRGNNIAPDASLWLELEFASDGGLRWLLFDATSQLTQAPFVLVTYDDATTNQLMLEDTDLDGFPDAWLDESISGHLTEPGRIDETVWHTVRWKIANPGETGYIEVDGDSQVLGVMPGSAGRKIVSVWIGIPYINAAGGGWWYTGRIKIGTSLGADDVVIYSPNNDGYPWSTSSPPIYDSPQSTDSPDLTQHKNYYIDLMFESKGSGGEPDSDIFYSFPAFADPGSLPPSGGGPGGEIWQMDQTGLVDVSLSSTPGFPSARKYRLDHGTNKDAPNFWWDLKPQVTNYGLEALATFNFSTAPDIYDLYRIDVSTDTRHLIKSGSDYPVGDSRRNQSFTAQFSPSGDIISYIKRNGSIWEMTFADRTGSVISQPLIPSIDLFNIVFDPLDETRFYYGGLDGSSNPFASIYRGYGDGVTAPDVVWSSSSPGVENINRGIIKISPDGTKVAFLKNDDVSDITTEMVTKLYVMNKDGTGLTSLTSTLDPLYTPSSQQRTIRDFSWSRDGSSLVILTNLTLISIPHPANILVSGEFFIVDATTGSITGPIVDTTTDGIYTDFPNEVMWFHGWQGE